MIPVHKVFVVFLNTAITCGLTIGLIATNSNKLKSDALYASVLGGVVVNAILLCLNIDNVEE